MSLFGRLTRTCHVWKRMQSGQARCSKNIHADISADKDCNQDRQGTQKTYMQILVQTIYGGGFICYLVKLATKNSISRLFSYLQCLHLWLDIECDSTITWNFHILFQFFIKISRSISIPEEGDMAKLDSFTIEQKKLN